MKTKEIIARSLDMPISTKHAKAICKAIKGMTLHEAMHLLDQVMKQKQAIAMTGEIPHRKTVKGAKIASGRFPVKAAYFIKKILLQARGNARQAGLDEDLVISFAKADKASRPIRPGRTGHGTKRFKRTHVILKVKPKEK